MYVDMYVYCVNVNVYMYIYIYIHIDRQIHLYAPILVALAAAGVRGRILGFQPLSEHRVMVVLPVRRAAGVGTGRGKPCSFSHEIWGLP